MMTAVVRTEAGLKAQRADDCAGAVAAAEPGRPEALFRSEWWKPEHHVLRQVGLGLAFPCAEDHADAAAMIALNMCGVFAARIVPGQGRFRFPLRNRAGGVEENCQCAYLLPV